MINITDARLLDEHALVAALERGLLYGAGLDCIEEDPPCVPLRQCPKAILTPRIAYESKESLEQFRSEAFEDVLQYLR